ncbi:MAG: hypothetical protein IJA34_07060 [Lachnospiraceae bacterium]|nr:hypothetical protein [Lachnospiraceae bacterium]
MKWKNKGHEFDAIGSKYKELKGILVYGAGELGVELHKILKGIGADYKFVDDYLGVEKKYLGVEVVTSDEMRALMREKGYIIVLAFGRLNTGMLLKQLILEGMVLGENLFEYHSFVDFYLHIIAAYRYNKCFIYSCGVKVINTCTLRCEKCMSALPYTQEKNLSLEEAMEETDFLFSKLDFICYYGIGIGEGFLYKDLDKLIEYTMEKYKDNIGVFAIVTNGTIVPSERVLEMVKKYNISIRVSNYYSVPGWKEKYAKLCEVLKKHEIIIQDYKYDEWIDMGWCDRKKEKDRRMTQKKFDNCGMNCRAVVKGRLTYCIHSMAANEALYQIDIEKDELDLSEEIEDIKKIIMEYDLGFNNNGALTMCQFCNGYININKNKVAVATQLKRG